MGIDYALWSHEAQYDPERGADKPAAQLFATSIGQPRLISLLNCFSECCSVDRVKDMNAFPIG
jgi:hypothetical protein